MPDAEIGRVDVAAVRAEERDEQQPEHVVRGDARGDARRSRTATDGPVSSAPYTTASLLKNPLKPGTPRDREHAGQHRDERERQRLAQAAHAAHVLLVGERVDHDAGAQEQLRLEERVGEEMEHARVVRAHADAHDHVADLRHRRVGQDAFDVPLRAAQDRAGERGHARR